MADACKEKINTEDASDEGGTCPPKPVMPQNKEEEEKTEDMDDPTNGIFTQRETQRQPNGSESDVTESVLLECSVAPIVILSQCEVIVI